MIRLLGGMDDLRAFEGDLPRRSEASFSLAVLPLELILS